MESSPNNLDPRQGTDAQSERIGPLIFDALVKKDTHYNLAPWLATSWEEQPDPLTGIEEWVFHMRDGVRFQDGRPLEAADVVWTIESLIDPSLTEKLPGGTLISPKAGAFANVDHAEASDRLTLVVHMKRPDAGLLFNMSDGLFGVVPRGAGSDFGLHPVGSGPYRFVSQVQDKEVVLERSPGCWSERMEIAGQPAHTEIRRLQFNVVPDTITSALELQKGSADAASNVLTPDMVYALRDAPGVETATGPGSNVWYLNFNVTDPALRDKRRGRPSRWPWTGSRSWTRCGGGTRGWLIPCCRRDSGRGRTTRSWRSIRMIRRGRRRCCRRRAIRRAATACGCG